MSDFFNRNQTPAKKNENIISKQHITEENIDLLFTNKEQMSIQTSEIANKEEPSELINIKALEREADNWINLEKRISDNKDQLTNEELEALYKVANFKESEKNFSPDYYEQICKKLVDISKHNSNKKLLSDLQEYKALARKYLTKDENRFNAFKNALKQKKSYFSNEELEKDKIQKDADLWIELERTICVSIAHLLDNNIEISDEILNSYFNLVLFMDKRYGYGYNPDLYNKDIVNISKLVSSDANLFEAIVLFKVMVNSYLLQDRNIYNNWCNILISKNYSPIAVKLIKVLKENKKIGCYNFFVNIWNTIRWIIIIVGILSAILSQL